MRKIIATSFFTLALLLCAQTAFAQTIGFKLGMTSSKFAVDGDDDGLESLTGLGVGGFVRFGFSGLNLQIEALGVTKGTEIKSTEGDFEMKVEYIEIPVTAMFSLGRGPYVFGGGSVAFETSCKFEDDDASVECDVVNDLFGEEVFDTKKTDVGVLVGAGYQFPVGPGSVLVEGRHTWGLTNILDSDAEGAGSIKNRSFAFMAGYAIPIGGR